MPQIKVGTFNSHQTYTIVVCVTVQTIKVPQNFTFSKEFTACIRNLAALQLVLSNFAMLPLDAASLMENKLHFNFRTYNTLQSSLL